MHEFVRSISTDSRVSLETLSLSLSLSVGDRKREVGISLSLEGDRERERERKRGFSARYTTAHYCRRTPWIEWKYASLSNLAPSVLSLLKLSMKSTS